jgi:hypothetical protein
LYGKNRRLISRLDFSDKLPVAYPYNYHCILTARILTKTFMILTKYYAKTLITLRLQSLPFIIMKSASGNPHQRTLDLSNRISIGRLKGDQIYGTIAIMVKLRGSKSIGDRRGRARCYKATVPSFSFPSARIEEATCSFLIS